MLGLVLVDIACPGGGIRRPACDLVADKITPFERALRICDRVGHAPEAPVFSIRPERPTRPAGRETHPFPGRRVPR